MAVVIRGILDVVQDLGLDIGDVKGSPDNPYYTMLCPFHDNTRTPAMIVYPSINKCQCKGACNRYWNPSEFYSQFMGVSLDEATAALSERVDPIVLALRELETDAAGAESREQLQVIASLSRTVVRSHLLSLESIMTMQKRVDQAIRNQDYLAAKHILRVSSRNVRRH